MSTILLRRQLIQNLQGVVDETKRLLGMPPGANEAEVVYGLSAEPGQVAVLTRSMLGVLGQLALQIDVPPDDVAPPSDLSDRW